MFTRKLNSHSFFAYFCALVLCALICVSVAGLGSAQIAEAATGVPTIFSYQGRLSDSGGNLVGSIAGTPYYFKFSIWDVATGGSQSPDQLWPAVSPTAVTLTVRQGVFNVNIGDTANGYPDTLDYNFNTNKNVYLQVEVSADGSSFEALTPRQRISSSPFAQVAGSVSGTSQSSFGTTTPVSNAVVTIEATTSTSIPALIRAASGQSADLFSIQDHSLNHLFSIDALGGIFGSSTLSIGSSTVPSLLVNTFGNVGIGTALPGRRLNVFDSNSTPQLRLSQSGSVFGELYTDPTGDVQLSSTGGNYRLQDENLWVCAGGNCGATPPPDKGNVIVENSLILNNNFKLKQVDASTTVMYDSAGNDILEFDEGQ